MTKPEQTEDARDDTPSREPANGQSASRDDSQPAGKRQDMLPIVGIGASAGSLAALKEFFAHVPPESGFAYVVVVHLSPEHKSHLAELLQPHLKIPIQQVRKTTALKKDHVYVIPPNSNLDTIDTHLRLTELEENRRERAPVDHFFRTLARTHDSNAIGVILTGTGSDGTLGLRQIKQQGGLTLVQDPNEAEYDGMPRSAIVTGVVDLVLPLADIPAAIQEFANTQPRIPLPEEGREIDEAAAHLLHKIFVQLRARTGRDFTYYKRSTILRRIARRMQFNQLIELTDYLDLLRSKPDEVNALADDLLITVTSFFRDKDVFESLEREIIPQLFAGKQSGDTIRVWTVGCATGEEAYSYAILLLEEAARQEKAFSIQIFASDLHEYSLQKAREGFYPGDIESEVSSKRLGRFFDKVDCGYRIRKEVRELVVFAPHNLIGDPPFSQLDLLSCRNLMIYLQRDLQRDVAEVFHYALKSDGFLIIGTSETIDAGDLFRVVSKKSCIYQKRNVPGPELRLPVFPMTRGQLTGPRLAPHVTDDGPMAYGVIHQRLAEEYTPPSVLVSPDDRVAHISEHAGRYLAFPGGEPTMGLLKLVRYELRLELRSALHSARDRRQPVSTKPVELTIDGRSIEVVMHVRPARDAKQESFVLVIFDERSDQTARALVQEVVNSHQQSAARLTGDQTRDELEAELDLSRQRLQSIIEEYETSQEELKASNEELQSANEELRSTLEELETSKEELQSMNEELQTLNQENRHKVEELGQLAGDLQNLLAATDIATLFLDRDLQILRFTPTISELFNIRTTDRGRPISDLTHRLGYTELAEDAVRVLRRLVPIEREVQDFSGNWYLTRVLPYRSSDDRIDGIVITFVEITGRKNAEEAVRQSEERYRRLFESIDEGFCVLEVIVDEKDEQTPVDFEFVEVNPAFELQTGINGAVGRRLSKVGLMNEDDWFDIYRQVAITGEPVRFKKLSATLQQYFEVYAFRLGPAADRRIAILFNDITERERIEGDLRESESKLRSLYENSPDVIVVVDNEGTIRDVNAASVALHQVPAARLVGTRMSRWIPEELHEQFESGLEELLAGERNYVEGSVYKDDGSKADVEVRANRITYGGDPAILLHVRDTTERKRAEETNREHEQRFGALVEQVRDYAIFMIDPDGAATTWNEGVRRVLGFAEADFIGRDVAADIFTPEDVERGVPDEELAEAAETGTACNDRWMLRKDGTRFWATGITTALRNAEGTLLGFMKVMRDQTEQKRLEEELRRIADELAETSRRKDEFLATLAHELRNPLAPIRTGLELIRMAGDDPAVLNEARNTMERQTQQLIALVDDLLEVSRITQGKLRLRRGSVLVTEVTSSAVEASRSWIEEANHELYVSVPDEPIVIYADPHRLAQVISNLLNNAAKYTRSPGHIWLTVTREDDELVISVRDDGIGIPDEMLERIFEMFSQIDASDEGQHAGLGIGLTLVRSLVDLHGGRISVQSGGRDHGSEFIVHLPIVTDTATAKQIAPNEHESGEFRKLRVLIVDDNRAAVDMLAAVVRMLGNDVETANDGLEAIKAAETFRPDVIVMDLGMPKMSGCEAAEHIRKQDWGQEMFLVALTGWGQEEDRQRTAAAGFDHHLVKPPEPGELKALFDKARLRKPE